MASNTVKVTLLADAKGFQRGMKDAESSTSKFEAKAGGFSTAVQGFFAGAAATAVIGFAKASIDAFAEAEQAIGSVESVFGDSADQIVAKSQEAAEEFGLSAAEFNTQASLIGSQLKNQLGLSAEEAADKTEDLIGKASDLAATFGGTTADAVAAISGLLRGERDSIEKYGVSMNDAAIEAHALEKGLAASNREMTPQIEAAAALDILYEQSADSAGQFASESDTLAGKQQRLTAQFEDMRAEIGEKLAPAFGFALDAIAKLQPAIETLITTLDGATQAFQPLIDEMTTLLGIVPEETSALETVGGAIAHTILPFLGPFIAGLHNINTVLGTNKKELGEVTWATEDARTHGLEPLAEVQHEVADATRDHLDAIRELRDEQRAQMDPLFAYAEAQRDVAEAQAAVTEAAKEFGDGSPQHLEALDKLREAGYDVKDAELAMADQMGTSRSQMETHLRALGIYTEKQIDLILDDMERINAFEFRAKTIAITHKVTGGGYQRQHGGPVMPGTPYLVGERGPEIMVPATAGRVLPNSRTHGAGTGAGAVYNITINAGLGSDPNAISRGVVQALQRYERANGTIPITTRPAS